MRKPGFLVMAAATMATASGPVLAAPAHHPASHARGVADPRALVTQIYAAYQRGGTRNVPHDPAYAYSPRLAALFAAYARWQRGHDGIVGALDFNWWMNAQDWEISQVVVTARDTAPDRRTVTATFHNIDRTDTIRFLFARTGGRWYLDDAVNGSGQGDDGWTLSALLRDREG